MEAVCGGVAPTFRPPTARVLGVRIDSVPSRVIVSEIIGAIDRGERALVVNANAHLLSLASQHGWIPALFDRAAIAFCDGAGAQLASRLLTGLTPARSTPPEWAEALGHALGARGGSVFWLGGAPEVVARAAANFEQRTGARTAGVAHGYFDHRAGSADNARLLEAIRAAAPDLLLVNMGMPLQERWLHDHWHLLDVPVALTAGALVDHVAGLVRRPPSWVSGCGMEWAYRLAVEPRRLWRRYLLGLPRLGWRVALAAVAPAGSPAGSSPVLPAGAGSLVNAAGEAALEAARAVLPAVGGPDDGTPATPA